MWDDRVSLFDKLCLIELGFLELMVEIITKYKLTESVRAGQLLANFLLSCYDETESEILRECVTYRGILKILQEIIKNNSNGARVSTRLVHIGEIVYEYTGKIQPFKNWTYCL
jgi:hypothetical protein